MLRTFPARGRRAAYRAAGSLICVGAATAILQLAAPTHGKADQCGWVSCTDVTSDYVVRVTTNIMRDLGINCDPVLTVRLLDKSVDNLMMIYHVRCHDGEGPQLYQLLYWARDREIILDKFSGSFMRQITKKYPTKIGLEER